MKRHGNSVCTRSVEERHKSCHGASITGESVCRQIKLAGPEPVTRLSTIEKSPGVSSVPAPLEAC
jgi:hypothetical protein